MTSSDIGAWRDTDPPTSEEAARSISVTTIKHGILKELKDAGSPLNGWELSLRMQMPTITVVPRFAPMRRDGWIEQQGRRPGPSNRAQVAYVITDLGRKILGAPYVEPIDYARSLWPRGFTKPEIVKALHRKVNLEELVKKKAIQDTGSRRNKHVVYRFRPHQLRLPLEE